MLTPTKRFLVIAVSSALLATVALLATAAAQKANVPRPQNRLALGEDPVKELLLLMDADTHGKVSKQEYMKFMEAEFERLDRGKTGTLDVKELTRATVSAANHSVGK